MKRFVVRTCFAISCVVSSAYAQDANKASATLLFDEAQNLMGAGQVAKACLKFAESQKLDPQLGTLLYLADCLEQNGQTASAWSGFREAAELAQKRGDERQQAAEERAAALETRLSKLRIEPPQGIDPKTVRIERDGVQVGTALWSVEVPVDPGEHTIVVSAEGRRSWTGSATVAAGGAVAVVEVPVLEVEEKPAASPTSSSVLDVKTTDESSTLSKRWPAVAAAAVGVGGVALGTIFGLRSMSQKNEADDHCDGSDCHDDRGVELREDAISSGNISTIGFIVGGVGLAAGTVLWITLGSSDESEGAQVTASVSSGGQRAPRGRAVEMAARVGVGADGLRFEGSW